jgi:hypothetical protein
MKSKPQGFRPTELWGKDYFMESKSHRDNGALLISSIVFGAALIICALIVRSTIISVKNYGRVISVTGAAVKPISSDYAIWDVRVQTSSTEIATAYAKIEKDMNRLKSFILDQGFMEADYEIGAIQINKMTDRENRMTTYGLAQTMKVDSRDIAKIKNVSTLVSTLIEEGIELASQNPRYICTKLDEYKIEMIKAATENAKLRAEQLAQTTGKHIGAPTNARVGVFQIRPLNSQEVSDYGINDVTSIEKEIVCTVQISFIVE